MVSVRRNPSNGPIGLGAGDAQYAAESLNTRRTVRAMITRSIVSDLRKTTDLEESKLLYIKSVVHQHTTTICFFCVMGGITIFA